MAISKAGSIGVGLLLVGVGIWQAVQGFQACNGGHGLTWGDKRATSVEIGDFTIKIPAGWRDASEATDQKMKDLLATQPGAHVLVHEKFDEQMVMFKTGPSEPVGDKPPCEVLATTVAKSEGATPSDITQHAFEQDPGCRWTEKKGSLAMQYNVRFHGTQVLLVACSGGADCEPMVAAVSVKK